MSEEEKVCMPNVIVREKMNIIQARDEALKGLWVAREGWNGNGMHAEVRVPDENSRMTFPYWVMVIPECKEGTRLLPWQPAQVDLFTDDWFIVEQPKGDS